MIYNKALKSSVFVEEIHTRMQIRFAHVWHGPSGDQPLSIGAPFGAADLSFEIDAGQHGAAHEVDQQRLCPWVETLMVYHHDTFRYI